MKVLMKMTGCWYLVLKKLSEEFLKLFSNIDKLKENNVKESAIV